MNFGREFYLESDQQLVNSIGLDSEQDLMQKVVGRNQVFIKMKYSKDQYFGLI